MTTVTKRYPTPRGLTLALLLGLLLATGASLRAQQAGPAPEREHGSRPQGGVPGGEMIRGSISAVSADSITVKTEGGQIVQVVTTPNTRIMKQRQPVKLVDLKPGDGVGAAGVLDSSTHTLHAAFLFAVDAVEVRKAQENLGKTYITGHIIAIDELKITVARPDGVSQVIEVDEGTSFRRGGDGMLRAAPDSNGSRPANAPATRSEGESITLGDLKVGDNLFATGALKNGAFHAIDLRIAPPRHRGAPPTPQAVQP